MQTIPITINGKKISLCKVKIFPDTPQQEEVILLPNRYNVNDPEILDLLFSYRGVECSPKISNLPENLLVTAIEAASDETNNISRVIIVNTLPSYDYKRLTEDDLNALFCAHHSGDVFDSFCYHYLPNAENNTEYQRYIYSDGIAKSESRKKLVRESYENYYNSFKALESFPFGSSIQKTLYKPVGCLRHEEDIKYCLSVSPDRAWKFFNDKEYKKCFDASLTELKGMYLEDQDPFKIRRTSDGYFLFLLHQDYGLVFYTLDRIESIQMEPAWIKKTGWQICRAYHHKGKPVIYERDEKSSKTIAIIHPDLAFENKIPLKSC